MDIQQIEKTISHLKTERAKLEQTQLQLLHVRNLLLAHGVSPYAHLKEQFAALKSDYDACESQLKALLDAFEKK